MGIGDHSLGSYCGIPRRVGEKIAKPSHIIDIACPRIGETTVSGPNRALRHVPDEMCSAQPPM